MDNSKKQALIINSVGLTLFLGLIIGLSIFFAPKITGIIKEPELFRQYILSFKGIGILIFMLFQVLQVIIAVIPGEFIQIAGGYIYGTWLGTLYSLMGIMTGYCIVFSLSRLLGYGLVKILVKENDLERFKFLINDPKSEIILFMLFLIPGLPKDMMVYIAGITPIKAINFFIIILIARIPAMLGSSYIGSHLEQKNYTAVIIMSVAAGLLFIIGLVFKDKIINWVHNFRNKKNKDK